MTQEALDSAEAGLLSAIKSGNARAIELFKGEIARLQSGDAAALSAPAKAPASGTSVTGTAGEEFVKGARKTASIAVMAPSRALAGATDLLGLGINKAGKALGAGPEPLIEPGFFSKRVGEFTDDLAGQKLSDNPGRAALEGAMLGPLGMARVPLMAGITSRLSPGIVPEAVKAVSGSAAAGASTQAALEGGMSPWAAVPLGVVAGHGVGGAAGLIPKVNGLTAAETLSKGKLLTGIEGVSQDQLAGGGRAMKEAAALDQKLLPSQALSTSAPEMEALQQAMLASRSSGGTSMREGVAVQSQRNTQLIEGLRNAGKQTPRGDDQLAEGVKSIAQDLSKDRYRAINDATRSDYKAPASGRLKSGLGDDVDAGLKAAEIKYRSSPFVVDAIKETRAQLVPLLRKSDFSPNELAEILQHVKTNILPNAMGLKTSDKDRIRGVLSDLLAPLDDIVTMTAPRLTAARKLQASLRADLPGQFDEVIRTAEASGGPRTMLNAVAQRSEMVGGLASKDPQLAQEMLQRTVNNAITKALEPGKQSGVQAANAGLTAKSMLVDSLEGAATQKNLELMFRGHSDPAAAAAGFNRVLDTVARAAKPTGMRQAGAVEPPFVSEAIRGGAGSTPQKVNVLGKAWQGAFGQFRDNATVAVLTRPDVMERLSYIASLPKVKLTPALLSATLPQLFENQNGP